MRLVKLFAISMLLVSQTTAIADSNVRFPDEATTEWKELEQLATRLHGSFVEVTTDTLVRSSKLGKKDQGKSEKSTPNKVSRNSEFFVDGTSVKTVFRDPSIKYEEITCDNGRYDFSIFRTKGQDDYRIKFVEKKGATRSAKADKAAENARRDMLDRIHAPWSMLGESLGWWLQSPGFIVRGVQSRRVGDVEKVLIKFSYESPDKMEIKNIRQGQITLNPANRWCIDEFLAERSIGTITARLSYGDGAGIFPKLKERVTTLRRSDGSVQVRTLTFQQLDHDVSSGKVFMLSDYGLPEPNFEASGPAVPYWLLFLGLCLAVISYALFKKQSRSQSGTKAVPWTT